MSPFSRRLQVASSVFSGVDLVLGTTKPTAANSGPRIPVSTMTIAPLVNGDYTVSTAGVTVQGLDIRGNLIVNAANVTIQDCIIRGHINRVRTDLYSVDNNNPFLVAFNSTGGVIQFCDVGFDTSFGGFPGYWQNGIGGSTWKAYRCDIHDAVDWTDAQGGGKQVQLLGCYLHDISMRNDDKNQSGGTNPGSVADPWWSHSDGCQLKGTTNTIIKGNFFANYASATTSWLDGPPPPDTANSFAPRTYGSPYGCGVQNTVDTEVNEEISYNWFWGGDTAFAANRPNSPTAGRIFGNRVSYDQYTTKSSRYTFRWSTTTTMICPNVPGSGGDGLDMNIWDPDGPNVPDANKGKPLTVGTSGGIRIP
jgi:hypothetical protein